MVGHQREEERADRSRPAPVEELPELVGHEDGREPDHRREQTAPEIDVAREVESDREQRLEQQRMRTECGEELLDAGVPRYRPRLTGVDRLVAVQPEVVYLPYA